MKKLIASVLILAFLTACGSFQNQMGKTAADMRTGDYRVTLYSGGEAVKTWELTDSYVNAGEEGGVWYFFNGGKLVRISGDVLIEEK